MEKQEIKKGKRKRPKKKNISRNMKNYVLDN